jgi:hypothetical protein
MRTVRSKLPEMPQPWIRVANVASTAFAADSFDDRVSENIFDVEDEWAEMEIICPGRNSLRKLNA